MIASQPTLERRQMFAEIKKLCEPNNYTNALVIAREYVVLAATIAGCLAAYNWMSAQGWSTWSTVLAMAPIYLLTIFIIGAWTQNRLSVLVHEASHFLLFRNRVLNDAAANLFLLFPVMGAIANYRTGHWGHHRHVNDPEHDPDLHRLTKHQARDFPITKSKFLWNYVFKQVFIHKAVSYLIGRFLYVGIPMKSEPIQRQDGLSKNAVRVMRLTYYAVLFGTLIYFNWLHYYVLFWLVPLFTFYPAILFLREIAHHGNYPDSGDFTNSRVYKSRWLEREIFFPFGEHNHVLHHMFPTIPHHRMHDAHEVMLRYAPYRDTVVTCNGFFVKADPSSPVPSVLDILAAPPETYLRNHAPDDGLGDIRRTTVMEVGGKSNYEPVA